MFVLGLQGSPRVTGNTAYLLDVFLDTAAAKGACIRKMDVARAGISPCDGCAACEKTGVCAIQDDDMSAHVYEHLRRADVVVLASPVYFYGMPATLKALVDRSQALWARKYKLGLDDPMRCSRKGLFLALGATKGKKLFEGVSLTAKYFFDAVGAEYVDMLGYRGIETAGDMAKHSGVGNDVRDSLEKMEAFFRRKKILFACRENACRSQMASAFAAMMAGDKIDALSAGSAPENELNRQMVSAMAEIGIDMAYRSPRSIETVLEEAGSPDMVVTMGCGEQCPLFRGAASQDWDITDPAGRGIECMRRVRDEIRAKVSRLMGYCLPV